MADHHLRIPTEEELQKLPANGGGYWNRLVFQQSPYLLQHAANPVDWYPWGDEAFDKAKSQNKPIFLSIGYATCHWCHVMARESFEDEEVAALLNRDFVAIKVDREERPDIDQIHMAACQSITGRGGWPLNCLLTPEGHVFYATTYLAKHGRYGQLGMMELLPNVIHAWRNQNEVLLNGATQLNNQLQALSGQTTPTGKLADDTAHQAFEQLKDSFDDVYGGFGNAPKFPTPHQYLFLLRYWHRHGNSQALEMVRQSLQAMRLGGLYDHVGFGFHRYSTDNHWLLPHFEKMLYDQAILLMIYSEAYAATGDGLFKQTAREVIKYLGSRMQHPDGGFYSAEDADSEGVEGKFYVWHYEDLKKALSRHELDWLSRHFNIAVKGNYTDEASGLLTGANILHLSQMPHRLAGKAKGSLNHWRCQWQVIRHKLFHHREKRVHPLLDDKVLTDWNGLTIAALARSSLLLDERECLPMAEKAFDFVQQHLTDENGHLIKRFRNGKAGLPAHLDDYANMTWAALELYQASLEIKYLQHALRLTEIALGKFWDSQNGGFFFTEANTELAVRTKDVYDGAVPSGNAVMARNIAHLYQLTGQSRWQAHLDSLATAFSAQINRYPSGYTLFLAALDLGYSPGQHLILSGSDVSTDSIKPLRGHYLPNTVWLAIHDQNRAAINKLAPFTRGFSNKELTLYLCQQFACELPVSGDDSVQSRLKKLAAGNRVSEPAK
ncbi:thioredoxin domain-containing protein [Photobacterium sp. OFAV2-7]|uniref:thioredoxin domain-containing protein n=1 Tax=Photobacterium sp. OFAV2-7 TaxID=2917748 RepID=UPI001EF67740|nr:thioredoxin domain-containing protein [Photobacterium sp. OFAV2-7]MCG7584677.1 thioredoxin domain-containing protein [Photobacterium sp. OFAV2-7]